MVMILRMMMMMTLVIMMLSDDDEADGDDDDAYDDDGADGSDGDDDGADGVDVASDDDAVATMGWLEIKLMRDKRVDNREESGLDGEFEFEIELEFEFELCNELGSKILSFCETMTSRIKTNSNIFSKTRRAFNAKLMTRYATDVVESLPI